ncbi:MAG: hypothetical protein WCX82_04690 [archaeon]
MPQIQRKLNYRYTKPTKRYKLGDLDKCILLTKDLHKEQYLLVTNGKIIDIAKKRETHIVYPDENKIRNVRDNSKYNIKSVHTHPGNNRTSALPSVGDILGFLRDYLVYGNPVKNKHNNALSVIVGVDSKNNTISGKTYIYIPKEIGNQILKHGIIYRYENGREIEERLVITNQNGIPTFGSNIVGYWKKLDEKIMKNVDLAVSKQKWNTLEEKENIWMQEYFIRIQKLFHLKYEFHAAPGYKLNEENFFFEKT